MSNQQLLVDIPTTRELLGNISRTTLQRLHNRGELERVWVLGRSMTTRSSIDAYLQRLVEAGSVDRVECESEHALAVVG